jgi:hypothetical protein
MEKKKEITALNPEIQLHNEIDSYGDELTSEYYIAVMATLKSGNLKELLNYFKKYKTELMQRGINVPALVNEETLRNLAKVNEEAIKEAQKDKERQKKYNKIKNYALIGLGAVALFYLIKNKKNQ